MRPVLASVALLLLLVGCSSTQRFDTHGQLTLTSNSIARASNGVSPISNSPCSGTGGASDLTAGAQVTVSDVSGTTIALGQLDPGKYDRGKCTFTFTVPDTPAGQDIYGVTVSKHGGREFTRAQMQAGPWLKITYPKPFSLF